MTLTTDNLTRLKDAALEHVNEVRAELLLDPVDQLESGIMVHASQCPISNSVIHGVERTYLATSWTTCGTTVYDAETCTVDPDSGLMNLNDASAIDTFHMSNESAEFQRAFDRGEFPELIAE